MLGVTPEQPFSVPGVSRVMRHPEYSTGQPAAVFSGKHETRRREPTPKLAGLREDQTKRMYVRHAMCHDEREHAFYHWSKSTMPHHTTEDQPAYDDTQQHETDRAIRDERRHDFFIIDNVVIDRYAPVIGATPVLVYAYICRRANMTSRTSWPSHRLIATELGITESTVKRAIRTLTGADGKLGELPPLLHATQRKRTFTQDDGTEKTTNTSNLYRILPTGGHQWPGVGVTSEPRWGSPVTRKQDSREQDEEKVPADAGSAPPVGDGSGSGETGTLDKTPPPAPSPKRNISHDIVSAFCTGLGIGQPVNRQRAYGSAKKLEKAGYTGADIPAILTWARAQWWARDGFDLGNIVQHIDSYRTAQTTTTETADVSAYLEAVALPYRAYYGRPVLKRDEVERAVRAALRKHPDVTPEDMTRAIRWKWQHMRTEPDLQYLAHYLQDWKDAGRPEPRSH